MAVINPIHRRDSAIDFTYVFSRQPDFAIARRNIGSESTHVEVRPSSPHSDWIRKRRTPEGIADVSIRSKAAQRRFTPGARHAMPLPPPVFSDIQVADVRTHPDSIPPNPPLLHNAMSTIFHPMRKSQSRLLSLLPTVRFVALGKKRFVTDNPTVFLRPIANIVPNIAFAISY